jgi:hypothetical protein
VLRVTDAVLSTIFLPAVRREDELKRHGRTIDVVVKHPTGHFVIKTADTSMNAIFSEGLVECEMLFHLAYQVSREAAASDV